MKRFKCEVTRTDEYIIEFDENVINEEWLADFRNHMYKFKGLVDHAEHLAQFRARFGEQDFIDGYGIPLVNGKNPRYDGDESSLERGINIQVVSEDSNCDVDVEEIV
jgi:hypothetical protein